MFSHETYGVVLPGPMFVINHPKAEHYRSPLFDKVKRGDTELWMELPRPLIICGDVFIEFYNKPKMMQKV